MCDIKKVILFFLIFSPFQSFAKNLPDQRFSNLKYGIYVEDIYNVDYVNSTYKIVFWLWVNSDSALFDLEENIDIINSTEVSFNQLSSKKLKNGIFHTEAKISATILNKFDISKFPFDLQNIEFNIEFTNLKIGEDQLLFDRKNSRIIPEYIEKWKLTHVKFNTVQKTYNSNFGNTDLGISPVFNGFKIDIELIRNRWNLFIKLFLTLFISFFLAAFSLFLPNKLSEEKIGLMLASLFASIGNKYITDGFLPIQDSLNLSDKLHILTILFIAFFSIFAIYEQRKKLKDNRKVDYIMFFSSTLLYFIVVMFICW